MMTDLALARRGKPRFCPITNDPFKLFADIIGSNCRENVNIRDIIGWTGWVRRRSLQLRL